MKSRLGLLFSLLVFATAVALIGRASLMPDAHQATKPRIAFVTGGSGDYWQTTINGARAAAEKLGADLDVLTPTGDEDVDEQIKLLLSIDTDAIDGVAVSPLNAEQQTRLINRLSTDALIVTFDSDAPLSNRMNFVGAGNYQNGRQAAELLSEEAPDGAKVAVLVVNQTKDNLRLRLQGFREEIAKASDEEEASPGPELALVAVLEDGGDDKKCKQQLLDLFAEHPDLYGLAAMNARHGPIVVEALREAGRAGEMHIVAFDDYEVTLQGVADGFIDAVIAQDPYHYGFEAVRTLVTLHQRPAGQLPIYGESSVVPVGTQLVRQDNLDEFRQMKSRLAERP